MFLLSDFIVGIYCYEINYSATATAISRVKKYQYSEVETDCNRLIKSQRMYSATTLTSLDCESVNIKHAGKIMNS